MKASELITVSRDGKSVTVEWERKQVKNMNLRVRRDGSVYASSSARTSRATIERFIGERIDWILAAVARQRTRSGADQPTLALVSGETIPVRGVNHTLLVKKGKSQECAIREGELTLSLAHPEDAAARQRTFWRFWHEEALRVLSSRLAELYVLVAPVPPQLPRVTVKWMKSRWGSCTPSKGLVVLNEKLLLLPPAFADYVILHELCHFREANHSAAFYRELARVYPQHATAKRMLSAYPIPHLPR